MDQQENLLEGLEFDHPGDQPLNDNDVVISGMSSLMPGCENLKEWAEKLYNKENMVTSNNTRWKYSHPELSPYKGEVPGIDRCDNQFFMINTKTGHSIDPGSRKLLEQAYQALFDAGVSPADISRKRVGVFIAASHSESEKFCSKTIPSGVFGNNRAMFANRISYWMNVTGPSYVIDSACSGSVVALEHAMQAIQNGQCEAAFVGAAKLILHPMTVIHNHRTVPQNFDGKTKCYDVNADGPSISDSVSVIFLQKFKDARRVYAQLCHVKTEYSEGLDKDYSTKLGYHRKPEVISKFLKIFYEEAGVCPSSVEYVEGFGAADPDNDKSELQAIEEVFCKQRTDPLLVGSVTSNMGLSNPVSGLNGLIKILHAYQTCVMAANLNCDNPRQDILAIRDGRMQIVTEHRPIRRTYTALNNFSLSGVNGHALLKGFYKKKDLSKYKCDLPYLVTVSGRQESGVKKILNSIKSNDLDAEELALLREVYKKPTCNHLGRGFGLFAANNGKTVTLTENVNSYDETVRQLWFVYSGMGSQWAGMGTHLMRIPIFAEAIQRCDKALKPKGINIVEIITSNDENIFDNVMNAFVGITAIQIGLTDVLNAVGLVPDKIIGVGRTPIKPLKPPYKRTFRFIMETTSPNLMKFCKYLWIKTGHSVGELGCAYADNCFTTEETILLSYSRGLISIQLPFIRGSMAAVGLGYNEVSKLCPPEIEVACHNGPDSSTLSGPAEIMKEFVKELTARGIFAREVNCANIAYHSRYIAKAGPLFLKMGQSIIKEPKLRSKRWVSTSVPIEGRRKHHAMFSSAEYHTNNLLRPVLFEEASRLVPSGAVLVEIAPHGLLQAILKRSLPSDCRNVSLTSRTHSDASVHLLEALGKLYMDGCNVDTSIFYPKVEYPVSTKTRQLSHLVEHLHDIQWKFCCYTPPEKQFTSTYKPIVTVYDEEYKYLKGSIVEGRNIFPFAGILVFVWDTLAMTLGKKRKLPVEFKDVRFYDQSLLVDYRQKKYTITLLKQSGRFEVTEDSNCLIADGFIMTSKTTSLKEFPKTNDKLGLARSDFYKLLFEKGYEFTDELQSVHKANIALTKAEIEWKDNWTTFIDGIFQLLALRQEHYGVSQPNCVKRFVIDTSMHANALSGINNHFIPLKHSDIENVTRCGGVILDTVIFKNTTTSSNENIGFKTLKYIPFDEENNNVLINLYIAMQIVSENIGRNNIKVLSLNNNHQTDILCKVKEILQSRPEMKIEVTYDNEPIMTSHEDEKPNIVFISHEDIDKEIFNQLHKNFDEDTFLLLLGVDKKYINSKFYKSIFKAGRGETYLEMFKSVQPKLAESIVFPVKNAADLDRLQKLRKDLSSKQSLTVVTCYPPILGVKKLVQQMRAEDNFQTYLAMINGRKAEIDLKKLHNLELAVNVYQNDKWGGEYFVPLEKIQKKSENIALHIEKCGDIDSLHWVESKDHSDETSVTVHFAALNVFDAKIANGEISATKNYRFGMDFSGLTERKQPVMGIIPEGAARSKIIFKGGLLWPVPEYWSLEDAATVPLPYCLAFYCLGIKLRLVRGMNVLIHGGAGALGQAAISIALAYHCTVFTTVSDIVKKRFLRKLFPDLPENQIGNSRDESFRDMVQNLTKGNGCEIVISNVKRNLKNVTLHCCAMAGTTLDLVQIHERDKFEYTMSFMTKSRSYCPVDFKSVFNKNNEDILKKLHWMVSDGIVHGYVRPLSRVTYGPSEVSRAFHLLIGSRHRGRVLLRLTDQQIAVKPRIFCLPEATYLIVCDSNGFGFKLADKLIASGAKKLHIHMSAPLPHIFYKVQQWNKLGAQIEVTSKNLDNNSKIEILLGKLNSIGPVDAIFILRDDASLLLKLDQKSRKLCPSLRYFVVINGQQPVFDICQKRFYSGFPVVAINIFIKKFGTVNQDRYEYGWSRAVEIIEMAVQAKEFNIIVYNKQNKHSNLTEEIKNIPGLTASALSDTIALEKVEIDDGKFQRCTELLKNKFDLKVDTEIASHLTIAQLKKCHVGASVNKEELGIEVYFRSICSDELIANIELVPIETMQKNTNMRADDLKIEDAHMFIIPGLEGHHEIFKTLCKRLKMAAAVLQLGYENQNETIQETAQRFSKVIIHKLKYKNHFYLLGYEYGVPIVLELAAILENHGMAGTVYCLGGSPEEIRGDIENRLDGFFECKLQNHIIQHFCSLATQNTQLDLSEPLNSQIFEDKVLLCIKMIHDQTPFNRQYLSDVIVSAYKRIGFIRNYKYDLPALKSKVILIRAKTPIASNFPVTASFELHVPLQNVLGDLKCPSIINKHLGINVLEEFDNKNLCQSYLTNGDDAFVKLSLPTII